MILEPLDKRYQEVRTFFIQECDAVIALVGGKGTADSLQKAKLQTELADVGYAFVLMTPDDRGSAVQDKKSRPRARQNVVFEHGLLIGALGAHRVCAIVLDDVELPSDLHGVVYKHIPPGGTVQAIAVELLRELVGAGYSVSADALLT